jgi:lipopolysaccharide export system protein LptA
MEIHMNKAFIRTTALALLASTAALPAFAQLSAKGGAIVINSDKLEVIDAQNEALFTGRVDALQDDARLRADKLDVLFDKKPADADAGGQPGAGWGDVKTIIATGNVFYVTPKQVAKAEKAVYDVIEDQVVMSGNVVVTQGKNVIRGDKLVLQISTGRAVFDTTKTDGTPAGRVRAAFFPTKKEKPASEEQAN